MSDTCIRVLADPVQIKNCKEAIESYSKELAELARVYSLIGNPTRLKMMYLIIREGEMCPCDLSDILDISVGGVSQHLRKLKDGGLIVDRKVGQTIFYSVVDQNTNLFAPVLEKIVEKETIKPVA